MTMSNTPEENLQRLADHLAVDNSYNLFWPNDGTLGIYPAGATTFDFVTGEINGPGGKQNLSIDAGSLAKVQSFTLFTDVPVTLEVQPGTGKIYQATQVISASLRELKRVTVTGAFPYSLLFSANLGPLAPGVTIPAFQMQRETDINGTVLVKAAGAGIADALTPLAFAPYFGTKRLISTIFGAFMATIPVFQYGQKAFTIRNAGAVDAEVQVLGAMDLGLATALGFYADPDNPARILVPAGKARTIETSYPWAFIQLGAAVSAAAAPTSATALIVEMTAIQPGIRSAGGLGLGASGRPLQEVTSTGVGAIALSSLLTGPGQFQRAEVHFTVKPAAAANAILSLVSEDGPAYNAIWLAADPSTGTITGDLVFLGGPRVRSSGR